MIEKLIELGMERDDIDYSSLQLYLSQSEERRQKMPAQTMLLVEPPHRHPRRTAPPAAPGVIIRFIR